MKDKCYLIVSKAGIKDMRKSRGYNLKSNDIPLEINIEIPDELFDTPMIHSNIKITEDMVPKKTIDPVTSFQVDSVRLLEKELEDLKNLEE